MKRFAPLMLVCAVGMWMAGVLSFADRSIVFELGPIKQTTEWTGSWSILSPGEPSPIKSDGLAVMIVYETADLAKLPKSQLDLLNSTTFRQWLNDNCPKINGQPGWKQLDKDADTADLAPVWQDTLKNPYPSTPWLFVGDGKHGTSKPLPATEAEAMAIIEKYKGGR